VQIIVIEAAL